MSKTSRGFGKIAPPSVKNLGGAYLQTQGIDPSVLTDPSPQNLAKTALTAYLTSLGVPPAISGPLANALVNTVADGDLSNLDPKALVNDIAQSQLNQYMQDYGVDPNIADKASKQYVDDIKNSKYYSDLLSEDLKKPKGGGGGGTSPASEAIPNPPTEPEAIQNEVIPKEVEFSPPEGDTAEMQLKNVVDAGKFVQNANEAVDIDRYLKDQVKGFLPPMNWWDKMPDWPAISYTSIIMDQTRAAKKYILEGIAPPDETESEIESHKYPYKNVSNSVLMKGKIDPGTKDVILGHELIQLEEDKDTVQDTEPIQAKVPLGIVTQTTQVNAKYYPIPPIFTFPEVYRDDLTDQKNPALELVDMQKLVDEFLDIGQRIYDQQTENPTIFGFDDINSKYEKDKNVVLANYKQYKANVRKMEHLNNLVQSGTNNYLIASINYRHDLTNCSNTEEYTTRYLREKLLAWYNETDDPETKVWKDAHWLPGEPGYIEMLLTVGDYEWYNNLIAGLEDSVARLEDLEATLDLLASMANALGTIAKYSTSIELAEIEVETPDWDFNNTVTFTNEVIDQTMLKELLGVSEIIGSLGGELTPIRAELEGLRMSNQALLEEVRIMAPTFLAYPIIWTKLEELCAKVNMDIAGFLNVLILDMRGDYETAGKHSSPSHLLLNISEQLGLICAAVMADVQNIIDKQAALPTTGLNRLDSMLNKINEIRKWGPMCDIPWHYWMAIDNVNAAERLYNDIWSDVFDCWEREYITRVWRIVTEHHAGGVIPPIHYGKPLFSAECPAHLPALLAPVPVAYRDIDINYLSANCRKDFNFLTSWLTSTLYAVGVKRTALAAVINDTSLNGSDSNLAWLQMLNELNAKNIVIKQEIDKIISQYNGTAELLPKADLDKIVAAKELSPRHYSNQTLMNMSSELHLLNTDPVTVLKVATNENRTGTEESPSPDLTWDPQIMPNISRKEAEDAEPESEVATLEVNTIPTVGGPSEVIIDTNTTSDSDNSTVGAFVGDVAEFEPWHYMSPDWDTQRELNEIPVVVPPETPEVIPEPTEILDPLNYTVSNEPVPDLEVETSTMNQEIREDPDRRSDGGPKETPLTDRIIMGRTTLDESAESKVKSIEKFHEMLRKFGQEHFTEDKENNDRKN